MATLTVSMCRCGKLRWRLPGGVLVIRVSVGCSICRDFGDGGGHHQRAAGAHPSSPRSTFATFLRALHHGSREADRHRTERAFAVVTTLSLRCASGHGCLRRSLAVILLCRLSGMRATWRVGFRSPPPQAHAWVEAGGQPVCEIVDPRTIYTPMITV